MAHGLYALSRNGQDVGQDVWAILALRNDTFRCLTEVEQQWPVPHHRRAQLDVDRHWGALALWAEVDSNGTRHMATYVPSVNGLSVEVTRARLHDEERGAPGHPAHRRNRPDARQPAGGLSRDRDRDGDPASPARPTAGGQVVFRSEQPYKPGTYLDYASALFNFVILQHLRLAPGNRATFESVVLSLPSLEPLRVQQTYSRSDDELLTLGTSQVLARRYAITEAGSPDLSTTFWTDEHDVVLCQELTLEGQPYRCEMRNYHWLG